MAFWTSGLAALSSSKNKQNGSVRAIAVGGANLERVTPSLPSTSCGTPIRSSGASCVPSSVTHSNPNDSANRRTSADFPIPGAPQTKTGRTVAT